MEFVGTGGERMRREGMELLAGLDDLAVMGFVEVLSRLPFFWRLERKVDGILASGRVDLVLPIDYPGFNLRVTGRAHRRGVPVVFYIAPQVWAWKAHRAGRLARTADRIAVILPFEEEIFLKEGGKAEYVGHPLLDRREDVPDRETFCRQEALDPARPILAVFPGSRAQELRRHLTLFLEVAGRLRERMSELQVALARAPGISLENIDASIHVVEDGRALLRHARAALVKSGTTTLEAALEGVPFVVAYRTHPLTYGLARQLVKVDHVALANLVAGEGVVPEFLQDTATPEALVRALEPLLEEGAQRARMKAALGRVRERMGGPGAADRVAALVEEVLVERGRWSRNTEDGSDRKEGG